MAHIVSIDVIIIFNTFYGEKDKIEIVIAEISVLVRSETKRLTLTERNRAHHNIDGDYSDRKIRIYRLADQHNHLFLFIEFNFYRLFGYYYYYFSLNTVSDER